MLRSRRSATFPTTIGTLALAACLASTMACGSDDDSSTGSQDVMSSGGMESSGGSAPSGGAAGTDGSGGSGNGAAGGAAPSGDTWSSFGMDFMVTYCVSCHPNNPLSDRDYQSYDAVVADADRIRCGVSPTALDGCGAGYPVPSQFPIGDGPTPSDEERNRLVAWIDAGMPE